MKKLLILFPIILFGQTKITLSPYDYGTGWEARTKATKESLTVFLNSDLISKCDVYFWDSYSYTVSDSAVAVIEMSDNKAGLLFRFVEPPVFNEANPVETTWTHFVKASPLKTTVLKYDGWGQTKVEKITEVQKVQAAQTYEKCKKIVNDVLKDNKNKTWKDKDNKTVASRDKRCVAWQIVTQKTTGVTIDGKQLDNQGKLKFKVGK